MPRVVRKKQSFFSVQSLMWWGGVVLVLLIGFGVSYFLGKSDSGAIDINGKIMSVDQTGKEVPVNTNTTATQPNGGLRPQSADPNAESAPTAPEPTPQIPTETSTTTEATTTPVEDADTVAPTEDTAQ